MQGTSRLWYELSHELSRQTSITGLSVTQTQPDTPAPPPSPPLLGRCCPPGRHTGLTPGHCSVASQDNVCPSATLTPLVTSPPGGAATILLCCCRYCSLQHTSTPLRTCAPRVNMTPRLRGDYRLQREKVRRPTPPSLPQGSQRGSREGHSLQVACGVCINITNIIMSVQARHTHTWPRGTMAL